MVAKTASGKPKPKAKIKLPPNPVGRPATTLADLDPNWKQIMMDACQEGGSDITCMALLGIGKTAYYRLATEDQEFRETVQACKVLSQTWYEEKARNMIAGGDGNVVALKFMMQNMFGWRDKTQVSGDAEAPLVVQQRTEHVVLSKEDIRKELEVRGLPLDLLED